MDDRKLPLWHPHTTAPTRICSCLIALPCEQHHPDDMAVVLKPGIFCYDPRTTAWRDEDTDRLLRDTEFWWANEPDVLAELSGFGARSE